MAIYTYFRVSTQTQAEHNSIQMQIDVVNTYLNAHNLTADGSFEDIGISGTIFERDGLLDLLATLKSGDKVIIQNTSRLWRSDFVGAMVRHEISKVGADVISIEQPTYSVYINEPSEYLINGMMMLLDEYERMTVSIKLKKGRKAKAINGSKACGVAPYGYKWQDAEIVIDYNNNLIIKDIFDAYIRLKSLSKLREYTIEKGYKTSRGNDFSKQALALILHNDFYIGYVTHGDIKVKGEHTPIIDEKIFYTINPKA